MGEEYSGDLAGSVFWGADMKGSLFRDVDLTGTRISHAWLVDIEIDALVEGFVVNGVDVTAYVNERDPWYPLRTMLTPTDPAGMRATWAALEAVWAPVIARVQAMPDEEAHRSVNGEFSFVETLRHLLMAMDKWFTHPVLAGTFLVCGLSGLALPGLSTFISEFLVIVGTFQRYKGVASIAVCAVVLAAIYILWMYKRLMTGPAPADVTAHDLSWREKFVVAPIIAAFLVLGFFPKPALDVLNPAVQRVLTEVGVSDPAPVVPAAASTGSEK